jgi:hypothetical protein
MRKEFILAALTSWLLISGPLGIQAQEKDSEPDGSNPRVWQPRTKSVAVFRNGLGFFLREGEAAVQDGWFVAKDIPPAAYGALMIFSSKAGETVDVVGAGPGEIVEFDGMDAPKDLGAKKTRLLAALKLNVQLIYQHRGKQLEAAGKLVSVGADFVVLETSASNFAVPLAGITRMQVLDLPLRVHVVKEGGEAITKTKAGMAYLREGITWIPEYSLRILDETTAELTLRGTLINEAEDLVHCDVNFVVGVPHFAHSAYKAPIAIGQVIRSIGAAVTPAALKTQIMDHSLMATNQQRAAQFDAVVPKAEAGGVIDKMLVPDPGKLKEATSSLPVVQSPGGSDYTVYTKKDLTVRVGERAIVTLFTRKIRYSHIYRWTPPADMTHSLVLHNDTETAWTTGPCLAVSGDRPLTEDLLRYTPRGGRAELPVTTALNVAHDKAEVESARKFRAHSPDDRHFLDLVTLDGELRLKNFEKRNAHIIITVPVPGRPFEATDNGQKSSDPTKLQLLERTGTIRWDLELNAGETKVIHYKYERYVPSN